MRRAAAEADGDHRRDSRQQSSQDDRADDGQCHRHVLLELEGEETAEDRGDTLREVDDPGRAIDEHERHPDEPEDRSGRDADHDQLQERRHERSPEPSPR